jgi:quercetin dioxygenase-like cupin family protein
MSNKIVYVPARTGQAYWFFGDLFTHLVTGEESGGSYFTLEVIVSPNNGPLPHLHHNAEEQFYVVEGELYIWVGDQTFQVSAGDFVHIPRETIHSFKNGPKPAKMVATFSPAGIEKFFQEIGKPVDDRSATPPPITEETIARAMALEAEYGLETLLPDEPPVS